MPALGRSAPGPNAVADLGAVCLPTLRAEPALLPELSKIPQPPSKSQSYTGQPITNLYERSAAHSGRSFGSLSFSGANSASRSSSGGSDGTSSPPSSPETDSHPSQRAHSPPTQLQEAQEGEEEEDDVPTAPLPGYVIRPKGIAERERERASGFGSGGKKTSLVAQMQRKRADSLKWSKYKNMGSGVIELNLCQDELRRV